MITLRGSEIRVKFIPQTLSGGLKTLLNALNIFSNILMQHVSYVEWVYKETEKWDLCIYSCSGSNSSFSV